MSMQFQDKCTELNEQNMSFEKKKVCVLAKIITSRQDDNSLHYSSPQLVQMRKDWWVCVCMCVHNPNFISARKNEMFFEKRHKLTIAVSRHLTKFTVTVHHCSSMNLQGRHRIGNFFSPFLHICKLQFSCERIYLRYLVDLHPIQFVAILRWTQVVENHLLLCTWWSTGIIICVKVWDGW